MKTPAIAVAQTWQAVDSRPEFQHRVLIFLVDTERGRVQIRRIGTKPNGDAYPFRFASLTRFNGKSGGYKMVKA